MTIAVHFTSSRTLVLARTSRNGPLVRILWGWLMDLKVRNRLVTLRAPVTQRLVDPEPGTCSWLWVLPVPGGRIRIARVLVPAALAESGEWFSEDGYTTAAVTFVDSADDVDDVVRDLGGDPESLESPWRNEFPL